MANYFSSTATCAQGTPLFARTLFPPTFGALLPLKTHFEKKMQVCFWIKWTCAACFGRLTFLLLLCTVSKYFLKWHSDFYTFLTRYLLNVSCRFYGVSWKNVLWKSIGKNYENKKAPSEIYFNPLCTPRQRTRRMRSRWSWNFSSHPNSLLIIRLYLRSWFGGFAFNLRCKSKLLILYNPQSNTY